MVTVRGALAVLVLLGASAAPLRAESGADIFKQQCAKCHGASGASDTGMAKTKKIPPLAGDAKIAAMSDADLAKQILSAEKHPAKIKKLSADQAASVAAYVKGLAGAK